MSRRDAMAAYDRAFTEQAAEARRAREAQRRQDEADRLDGAALRRLREAVRDVPTMVGSPYINLTFSAEHGVICHTPGVGFHPGAPTIAEAADAARAQIEATR